MDEQESLAAAVRTINDHVRRVRHDAAGLAEARRLVDEASALLSGDLSNGPFMQAGLDGEASEPSSLGRNRGSEIFPYSPIIGRRNPISSGVDFWFEGDTTLGSLHLGATHNGPPDMVHGGMIALVMDELLGVTAVRAGLGGFTGTLSVRYQAPTPIRTDLDLWSEIDRVEGRKVFVVGEIRNGDVATASAEGIFIRAAGQ